MISAVDLAARITSLAAEQKKSVAEVLRLAGLNEKWLRDLRDKGHSPTLTALSGIATALNTSLASLVTGIPDANLDQLATLTGEDRQIVSNLINDLSRRASRKRAD